jgi:hypothetical protein
MIGPAKNPKAVPDLLKTEVEANAKELIENVLKAKHVQPTPEEQRFNYIIDIGPKWYRSYFYFHSTYACPGPNALSPSFESKFARMEYLGNCKFALDFMRHTGEGGVPDSLRRLVFRGGSARFPCETGALSTSVGHDPGEWVGLYDALAVDECMKAIQDDAWFVR